MTKSEDAVVNTMAENLISRIEENETALGMRIKRLTLIEAYRTLRSHDAFTIWQAICYALWICG